MDMEKKHSCMKRSFAAHTSITTSGFIFGGVSSALAWGVPMFRMLQIFKDTRKLFRIDYSEEPKLVAKGYARSYTMSF